MNLAKVVIESFLFEKIESSDLDGDVKAYLLLTLAQWVSSMPIGPEDTLADLYLRAQHDYPLLRKVGDAAMFLDVFAQGWKARGVDRNYVLDMGSSAYVMFGERIKSRLFFQLGSSLREVCQVLHEIYHAEESAEVIFQRWQKAPNPKDAALLKAKGIHVFRPR